MRWKRSRWTRVVQVRQTVLHGHRVFRVRCYERIERDLVEILSGAYSNRSKLFRCVTFSANIIYRKNVDIAYNVKQVLPFVIFRITRSFSFKRLLRKRTPISIRTFLILLMYRIHLQSAPLKQARIFVQSSRLNTLANEQPAVPYLLIQREPRRYYPRDIVAFTSIDASKIKFRTIVTFTVSSTYTFHSNKVNSLVRLVGINHAESSIVFTNLYLSNVSSNRCIVTRTCYGFFAAN